MAFAETDRVWIRHFLGFSATFVQAEPLLEGAMTAVQSIADGGSRADSATENYCKAVVYGVASVAGSQTGVVVGPTSTTGIVFAVPSQRGLIQIEANIANQDTFLGAMQVDGGEIEIDPVRETKRLRSEGRRLCQSLARMLGMRGVRADMFSMAPIVLDENPFVFGGNYEQWKVGNPW